MKKRISTKWKALAVAMLTVLMCVVMCFSFAACGSTAPYIGDDGYWYVNGEKTEYKAAGENGKDGVDGKDGADGAKGDKGDPGEPGKDGANGSNGQNGQDGEDGKDANATPPGLPDPSPDVGYAGGNAEYAASEAVTEGKFENEWAKHGGDATTMNGNFQHDGKFYADYDTLAEAQAAGHALGVQIAAEGDVLLKNNGVLPLSKSDTKFTLLGVRNARMIRSGFGSGSGGGSAVSTLLGDAMEEAGYSVNRKLLDFYTTEMNQMREDNVIEIDPDTYGGSIISTYNSYDDAAIVVLSRTGAENYDLATHDAAGHADPDDHALQLQDNEDKLIAHAKEHFDKVIVIINSSNIMQIPELEDDDEIDAILWVGGVGQDGAKAIPYILNGTVNPSGHTVDLWERDFTKSPVWTNFGPNTQNKDEEGSRLDTFYYDKDGNMTQFANLEYREGIYSGYRYYETAYVDADEGEKEKAYENVLYPFGYGLSYTDFEWRLDNIAETAEITSADQMITMRAWVKNTGNVPGKDVVQVYYSAPYFTGGIEKSAVTLVGFAKTDILQPGEAQVVTVSFPAQEMASFDEFDVNGNGFTGYELEAGDYTISLRTDSHTVKQGYISDGSELKALEVTRTVVADEEDEDYKAATAGKGATGILCKTDLVSGKEIKPVFTGDFTTVNESLKAGMISRATGMKQPAAPTKEQRTLDAETYADYLSQDTYYSWQDEDTDPWYVKNDGLPADWTQAKDDKGAITITLDDMAGVPYVEPTIVNGVVTLPEMSETQKANNAKWEQFMNQFTWEEIIGLPANPDSNIARIGSGYSDPDGPINAGSVQFPSNPILTATFDQELAYEQGVMIGNLLLLSGSRGWRGGGSDIHRSPFSGRNFEYYSEDGVMSGLIGMNVAKGVTGKGIIAHWKHFFGNDQETYRADYGGVFTWATEQTLREVTAKPFEYIIKYGGVQGLMTAFNRLGKWTQTTNYASHELLLNQEWDFQGSTECDAWAKQFVPANLMVRGGDDSLLSADSSYTPGAIERGHWDATLRGGKGGVKVMTQEEMTKDGEIVYDYDARTGSLESATHYFAVRKCAQRLLQSYANSAVNNNGMNDEVVTYTLTKNIYNSVKLAIVGEDEVVKTSDVDFTFGENVVWPDGMKYDANTGVLSGVPTGTASDVKGTFSADSWVGVRGGRGGSGPIDVTFKFKFESDLMLDGVHLTDGYTKDLTAGQAASMTITADQLSYGNQLNITSNSNRRIMNAYYGDDGQWYHRDEDKSAADIVTLGDMGYDEESSRIYEYSVTGLEGSGLTAKLNETQEMGWANRSTYAVNTSVTLSGTPVAGDYTVTVTLNVPHVSKGTNPWMRAAGTSELVYTQTFVIHVA